MNKKSIRFLVQAAIIAALYAAITLALRPLSFGHWVFQFRVSEALTVLPAFTSAAIPGLFIGCAAANLLGSPIPIIDAVLGSTATLIAAIMSYFLRKQKLLVPLPPVLINAFIVGGYLYYFYFRQEIPNATLIASMGWVALGQVLACYGLGYPLMVLIKKKGQLSVFLD